MNLSRLFVGLVALAACGDDSSVKCGDGTMLVGGECVAAPATECGAGTMLDNGVCVPSSTTTCGPGTKLDGTTCVADASAPGPVTALAAAVSGSNINLTWTAGTESTASLVVRTKAGAYDAPAKGVTYTAGMTLPGGSTVVAAGAAATASDAFTAPGRYTYLVWSQNAAGNYGFPREVSTVATIPTQTGVLTIDIAATTATVTTQPANIALAVTNLAYDAGGTTATFDLTVTNNTAGNLINEKAVVRTLSTGTLAGATGALANDDPFITIAPGSALPGVPHTKTFTVNNVGPTDTITLNLEVIESGEGLIGDNLIDVLGGEAFPAILPETSGNRHDSVYTDGFASSSGRYFYVTTRWHPTLFRIDTSDGTVSSVSAFAAASPGCLKLGADGYAYAAMQLGRHRSNDGLGLGLVKIDPITLTIVRSNQLVGDETTIGRSCALTATKLVTGYGADIVLADTATLAITDADATVDGIDLIPTASGFPMRSFAFSADGSKVYATATKSDLNIYAIDTATNAVSTYHAATTNRTFDLTLDSTGKLWWASASGLTSFDGTTETTVPNGGGGDIYAILSLTSTTALVASSNSNSWYTVDLTSGDTSASGTLDTDRMGHAGFVYLTP